MLPTHLNKYLVIIVVLINCCECNNDTEWEETITKLYELYISAINDGKPKVVRRMFTNDSEYQIHVRKLKQVNGFKLHNIIIKRVNLDANSSIYINNPLEAKLPHPFMTKEEFKKALMDQRLKDREAFMKSRLYGEYSRWENRKKTSTTKYTFAFRNAKASKTHKDRETTATHKQFKSITEKTVKMKKSEQTRKTESKTSTAEEKTETKTAVKHLPVSASLQQNITSKTVEPTRAVMKNVYTVRLMSHFLNINTEDKIDTNKNVNDLKISSGNPSNLINQSSSSTDLKNKTNESTITASLNVDTQTEKVNTEVFRAETHKNKMIHFEAPYEISGEVSEEKIADYSSYMITAAGATADADTVINSDEFESSTDSSIDSIKTAAENFRANTDATSNSDDFESSTTDNTIYSKNTTAENLKADADASSNSDEFESSTTDSSIDSINTTAENLTADTDATSNSDEFESSTTDNTIDSKKTAAENFRADTDGSSNSDEFESSTAKKKSNEEHPQINTYEVNSSGEQVAEMNPSMGIDAARAADSNVSEELTTETSTISTTHSTTTTVRVKWSRPRVFVGAPPESKDKS